MLLLHSAIIYYLWPAWLTHKGNGCLCVMSCPLDMIVSQDQSKGLRRVSTWLSFKTMLKSTLCVCVCVSILAGTVRSMSIFLIPPPDLCYLSSKTLDIFSNTKPRNLKCWTCLFLHTVRPCGRRIERARLRLQNIKYSVSVIFYPRIPISA